MYTYRRCGRKVFTGVTELLVRFRAAATRCRNKKKQWVVNLERKAEELQAVNSRLQVNFHRSYATHDRKLTHVGEFSSQIAWKSVSGVVL